MRGLEDASNHMNLLKKRESSKKCFSTNPLTAMVIQG